MSESYYGSFVTQEELDALQRQGKVEVWLDRSVYYLADTGRTSTAAPNVSNAPRASGNRKLIGTIRTTAVAGPCDLVPLPDDGLGQPLSDRAAETAKRLVEAEKERQRRARIANQYADMFGKGKGR